MILNRCILIIPTFILQKVKGEFNDFVSRIFKAPVGSGSR